MGQRIPLLGDIVERSLNKFFQWLGHFIGLHPLPFLIIPVFLTVVLSTGFMKAKVESNMNKLYIPAKAPFHRELEVRDEFWKPKPEVVKPTPAPAPVITNVTIPPPNPISANLSTPAPHQKLENEKPKDVNLQGVGIFFYVKDPSQGDNVLTKNRTKFILDIHHHVSKVLNYTYNGNEFNFGREMCDRSVWCHDYSNKALISFLTVAANPKLLRNPNIRYKYPVLDAFGLKIFLGWQVYGGSEIGRINESVAESHNETALNGTNPEVMDAKVIKLQYLVDINAADKSVQEYAAFQTALISYADSLQETHGLTIFILGVGVLEQEIFRNAVACFPFIALTAIALIVFTVLTTLTSSRITSKPWEAFAGAIACVMSIASTTGLMFYCGYALNPSVSVMPFLAFAIGIDDTFLALTAWHLTDPSLPPHKRLSLSLRESGTAITVTSLTDVVLFGMCAISSTPAITVFSIFTAVAMAFDYIYQLTFFTAVLAYGGRREAQNLDSCRGCCSRKKSIEPDPPIAETDLKDQYVQQKSVSTDTELKVARLFRTKYAPVLNQPITKICVFIFYILYLIISAYGCIQTKLDMTPSKAVMDDSPLQEYMRLQQTYLWEYTQADIYIRNAPDFRNVTEQKIFENLLRDLESTKYSRGNESTIAFYRGFQNYVQYIDHTPEQFYENLREFLDIYVHSIFQGSIHWANSMGRTNKNDPNGTIYEFMFSSGFGSRDWEGRLAMLKTWRNITQHYPNYDMVIFEGGSGFTDQYDVLEDETIQQVGIALTGMTVMAAFFIPSLSSIFWVGWTLLSMDFGVIGMLMLWGCDLDTFVMMNIVMSLDFAVEYAAHVCHRYYVSKKHLDSEKVIDTLGAIGWPVLQGGMAAILAVLPLIFVKSYIVRTFYKTVILVVGLGLLHALVFLPVFLSSVTRSRILPSKSAAKIRLDLKRAKHQKSEESR